MLFNSEAVSHFTSRRPDVSRSFFGGRRPTWVLSFAAGAFWFVLPPAIRAADLDPKNIIQSVIDCINQSAVKDKRGLGTVADVIGSACMPKGCQVNVLMSDQSAQPACVIDSVQLPRVIFSCNIKGTARKWFPSVVMCPLGGQTRDSQQANEIDHIEIGEQVEKVGQPAVWWMRMADINLDSSADAQKAMAKIDATMSVMPVNSPTCFGGTCHFSNNMSRKVTYIKPDGTKKVLDALLAPPPGNNNDAFRIQTSDNPGKKEGDLLDQVVRTLDKTGKFIDSAKIKVQNLPGICTDIGNHADNIENAAKNAPDTNKNANFSKQTLINLCGAIQTYAGAKACGQILPDGTALACAAVGGGGTFMVDGGVSAVSFNYFGNAQTNGPSSYAFQDNDGQLTAFRYPSHTLVQATQLTSLNTTSDSSGLTVTGSGTATIQSPSSSATAPFVVVATQGVSPGSPVSVWICQTAQVITGTVSPSTCNGPSSSGFLAGGTGLSGATLTVGLN